jgi:SapC.
MLLYRNVTVLSYEEHKELKLRPVAGFSFAEAMHWAPVAGVEFDQASHSYPIMFVGETNEDGYTSITPILLLGLSADRNDYIDADHNWKAETYLPAFVRRYPFIFAKVGDEEADELAVCFDAGFEGFNEQEGYPLFNEDGSLSDFLTDTINLISDFNAELDQTQEFIELLMQYDLLVERNIDIRNGHGTAFHLPGFLVINEEALTNLGQEQLETLNERGFLGWAFAHLASLSNLSTLLDMHMTNRTALPAASSEREHLLPME